MRSHFLRAVQKTSSTDPFFDQTTLLLHGDGTNGAQNNSFVSTPTSPFSYYVNFSGTANYLSFSNITFNGDFCAECWFYKTANPSAYSVIFGSAGPTIGATNHQFYVGNDGSIGMVLAGVGVISASGTAVALNQWNHIAWVRSGSSCAVFVNGVRQGTGTSSLNTSICNRIGDIGGLAGYLPIGYISNARIVIGSSVYDPTQTTLTVPTGPLTAITNTQLLTCQSPTIVDNSPNGFAITNTGNATVTSTINPTGGISGNPVNWYGTFNGSNQWLTLAHSANYPTGTQTFTMEAWFYALGSGTNRCIFSNTSVNAIDFGLYLNTSNQLFFGTQSGGSLTGPTISTSTWYHVAVTGTAGTVTMWLNGISVTSGSVTLGSTANPLYIGALDPGNPSFTWPFNGYISNFRLVNGTALYSTTFTPPQGTLPAVTNTQVLTVQSGAVVDSSPNVFAITNTGSVAMTPGYWQLTRNGNTTQGSFSPFSVGAGEWSNYFDGTGDTLTAPFSSGNFNFGTGNFTVEAWIYHQPAFVNNTYRLIWQNYNGATNNSRIAIGFNGDKFGMFFNSTSIETPLNSGYFTTNTWIHVAITRQSNTVRIFVNGVLRQTGSTSVDFNAGNDCLVGSNWFGYLSNVRVVKGTAVYTSAFTPPTSPLTAITNTTLLTCQSNRFRDNSANSLTITRNGDVTVRPFSPFNPTAAYSASTNGGSGYFDGNGDYLTVSSSPGFAYDTGAYTTEFWWYPTSLVAQVILVIGITSGGYQIYYEPSGSQGLNIARYGFAPTLSSGTGDIVLNQWNHIVCVRASTSSNQTAIFINGTRRALGTDSNDYSITGTLNIGGQGASLPAFGYFSDFRLVKGTAVYDPTQSTLTVPTAPLTPITNTSLLCNFINAGIFDNTAKNDLETVGNAQISTSVKKYGTGSLSFDGTGDWLLIPSTTEISFGTGDFTVECWINAPNTQPAYAGVYVARVGTAEFVITFGPSGNGLEVFIGATQVATTTANLVGNGWHHIAFVRNNGSCKIYADGVAGSVSNTNNSAINTTSALIGYDSAVSTRVFNGFMDDFRITKGIARYTANFTPPTAAFPDL